MASFVSRALFHLPAERAHNLAVAFLAVAQHVPGAVTALSALSSTTPLPRTVWGLQFRNPLGIAAGFDKNAVAPIALSALGFGFVEVGTVTLHPQAGNPKPRMFRYPEDGALINRLGFNNEGAEVVAARLKRVRRRMRSTPLFVNIGKNRDVPLESAAAVYREAYSILAPHADGVVINISSPNTKGLRDLQDPQHLRAILVALRGARSAAAFDREGDHPILVKIAPDLESDEIEAIAETCVELADGVVATNTTTDRSRWSGISEEAGGLSGKPLFAKSTEVLRQLRRHVGTSYPLIGVGGISSVDDAVEKLDAGATLIQVYTGFVYGGPRFPRNIVNGIARRRLA